MKQVHLWTERSKEQLRDCFEQTDWQLFFNANDNVHDITESITSYVNFCESNCVETKTVRIYQNNKNWFTKDLKVCLNERKVAFTTGDKELVREKNRELRGKIKSAKLEYKNKIESKFFKGNVKQAWEGLNVMMGRKGKKTNPTQFHNASFADELNVFFGRFDTGECSTEVDRICSDIPLYENITLEEHEIAYCLSRTKLNKAPGPDGLNGRVKDCVYQLTGVFTQLFQLLLNTRIVPNLWKVSTVVPVPKITGAKGLNDFRPISLTSVLGKCMERVIMRHLMYFVSDVLDPLQFAYKKARGTDDAVLTLYNSVAEHVKLTSNYARILFLDFTSAFNTMKIHILIQRLIDLGVNGGLIWWIKDFL